MTSDFPTGEGNSISKNPIKIPPPRGAPPFIERSDSFDGECSRFGSNFPESVSEKQTASDGPRLERRTGQANRPSFGMRAARHERECHTQVPRPLLEALPKRGRLRNSKTHASRENESGTSEKSCRFLIEENDEFCPLLTGAPLMSDVFLNSPERLLTCRPCTTRTTTPASARTRSAWKAHRMDVDALRRTLRRRPRDHSGRQVVDLISSIDNKAVTLCTFVSAIIA